MALNDFKIATVRPERHRPTPGGPVNDRAFTMEALEHRRRRVAKAVPAHADHRDGRPDGPQESTRRAAGRAVMPDLQHLSRLHGREEERFRRQSRVSREQDVELLEAQVQDQGVLIGRGLTGHPSG